MTERASADLPERGGGRSDDLDAAGGESLVTPAADSTESPSPESKREPAVPPSTRIGVTFSALLAGAIVLTLLLVFILENTESIKISFFGASGHVPVGVALLLAAIGGALLTGIVGAARILQLRRHAKRRPRRR